MQEVLVNRLGGLSLPRKSVVRLTDRPDMTLDVYRGRKTTMQQQQQHTHTLSYMIMMTLNDNICLINVAAASCLAVLIGILAQMKLQYDLFNHQTCTEFMKNYPLNRLEWIVS